MGGVLLDLGVLFREGATPATQQPGATRRFPLVRSIPSGRSDV
jgi:hypothetical protein